MLDSGRRNSPSKGKYEKKKYIFLLFLLASCIPAAAMVTDITCRKNAGHSDDINSEVHSVVKFACAATLYPGLCESAIAAAAAAPLVSSSNIRSTKDVIMTSLNLTITAVKHNYFAIMKLISSRKAALTEREKTALHDCLEAIDETLDELHKTALELKGYPFESNESISYSQHVDNLKTLLSAAMTNQETCIDGLSHDKADKQIRLGLIDGQLHVYRMCSNVLAMIKNLTDAHMASYQLQQDQEYLSSSSERRLGEKDKYSYEWPKWLSAGDRRLLQQTAVTPDVTVAADGSGNYRTVSAAVAAAPEGSSRRYVIRIKAGVYRENVEVPKKKTNIIFVGDGRTTTIITGSRNVVDGSTTFHSATVAVVGEGFLARDITFENTAGPSKHQAVALRVNADQSAFYRCDMLAYQDTLYVHSLRQFYVGCLIAGTVDFIFGNAAVVFQDCDIHARRPNPGQKNMVTAQGRDDPNQNTGIVIQKCRIGATSDLQGVMSSFPTYLGRPWKAYSRTVIMQSTISDVIHPAGWHEWNGNFALQTLFYAEYQNTGAGAGTSSRVEWNGFKVITSATEAQVFTAGRFISGSAWLQSTGFSFSLGL